MLEYRQFQLALVISVMIHSLVFFAGTNWHLFSIHSQTKEVKVTYVKTVKHTKLYPKLQHRIKREALVNIPERIAAVKKIPTPFRDNTEIAKGSEASLASEISLRKPNLAALNVMPMKRTITLPPIDMDKINNPSYVSYYQIVREKIKRAAYVYQNNLHSEIGEVYISFIISNDGRLQQVRTIEEKSSPILYLRDIALKSVKEASPFPDFPKDLDYPSLSFNIIISFQIE